MWYKDVQGNQKQKKIWVFHLIYKVSYDLTAKTIYICIISICYAWQWLFYKDNTIKNA